MWVKICGLTSRRDALLAARAGADACGFVLAPSSRRIRAEDLPGMAGGLPTGIARVGVFRDPRPEEVEEALRHGVIDLLQFHGDEPEELCRSFGMPYLKAVPLAVALKDSACHPGAFALLVEGGDGGGTGVAWDYSSLGGLARRRQVVLAGGLRPDNVAGAIAAAVPWGVDVCSGVEAAPGVKDPALLQDLIDKTKGDSDATS